MKARYAPLGPFSEMPAATKLELRRTLDVVCSAKYAHCAFSSCAKLAKTANPQEPEPDQVAAKAPDSSTKLKPLKAGETGDQPVGMADAVALETLAFERLNRLVTDRHRALDRAIQQAAKGELSRKLEWERIQMADEVKVRQEIEARKAETRQYVKDEPNRVIITAPTTPVQKVRPEKIRKEKEPQQEDESSLNDDEGVPLATAPARRGSGHAPPPPNF